eukprot:476424-Pyramimonas_sp.AAC.1
MHRATPPPFLANVQMDGLVARRGKNPNAIAAFRFHLFTICMTLLNGAQRCSKAAMASSRVAKTTFSSNWAAPKT